MSIETEIILLAFSMLFLLIQLKMLDNKVDKLIDFINKKIKEFSRYDNKNTSSHNTKEECTTDSKKRK